MSNMIYVAWRDVEASGGWYVIGALKKEYGEYIFYYTNGVKLVENFVPFEGMANLSKEYKSEVLFPLFHNRILSKKRPEYPQLIKWMGYGCGDKNPDDIELLALTGGLRVTDQLEMFNDIVLSDNKFEHIFFAHGFKHFPNRSQDRLKALTQGEKLKLVLDKQNDVDPNAVLIRTEFPNEIFAYCPRYIAKNIHDLLIRNPESISLTVELVNSDAPTSYQLLCKLSGQVEVGFKFMDEDEYKPYTV